MTSYELIYNYKGTTITLSVVLNSGAMQVNGQTISTHSIRAQYDGNDDFIGGYMRDNLLQGIADLRAQIEGFLDSAEDADLERALEEQGFVKNTGTLDAPGNFAATAVTSTTATLDWDAVSGADGYILSYDTMPDFSNAVNYDLPSDAPQTALGLQPNTLYYFRVQAYQNGVGYSPYATTTATTNP